MFFLVGALLALTLAGTAIGAPADGDTARSMSWPDTAAPERREATRALSNSDRFKRGLPIRAPVRLYDPSRVHSAPKARLSANPPPNTSGFYWVACYPGYTENPGTNSYTILASTDADAVNSCASHTTTDGAAQFMITYTGPSTYTCYTNAYNYGSAEECTQSNYVYYYESP